MGTFHTLRRKIGALNFSNMPNYQKASSKKSFCSEIEKMVIDFMEKELKVACLSVIFGRKELEEKIMLKYSPKYNTLSKRNRGGFNLINKLLWKTKMTQL